MDSIHTAVEPPACPPGALLVPLGGKEGIVAWAIIDEVDGPHILRYRWHRTAAGYARRNMYVGDGKLIAIFMHRDLLHLEKGDKRQCDHISGDRLDNRRANLRIVTNAQNGQNRKQRSAQAWSSRYRGVTYVKNPKSRPPGRPWKAYTRLDGKLRHLGFFATEEEAADAARRFRAEHMPYATD